MEEEKESQVYDRKEYAKKEFWDDRFRESKQEFDWYANWDQKTLRDPIMARFPTPESAACLQIGCGNAKLSAQMYDSGFKNMLNVDISEVVIEQMKEKYSESHPGMTWEVKDATALDLPDAGYDLVIDKGTFDALACGEDKAPSEALISEMVRVLKPGGCIAEITNGVESKRLATFEKLAEGCEITSHKIELSNLSTLINILRTGLKDKPLSSAKDNPLLLQYALMEIAYRSQKDEVDSIEPKTALEKMKKMMLRMRLKQKEEELMKKREEIGFESDPLSSASGYNPSRQDFAMLYLIQKPE